MALPLAFSPRLRFKNHSPCFTSLVGDGRPEFLPARPLARKFVSQPTKPWPPKQTIAHPYLIPLEPGTSVSPWDLEVTKQLPPRLKNPILDTFHKKEPPSSPFNLASYPVTGASYRTGSVCVEVFFFAMGQYIPGQLDASNQRRSRL